MLRDSDIPVYVIVGAGFGSSGGVRGGAGRISYLALWGVCFGRGRRGKFPFLGTGEGVISTTSESESGLVGARGITGLAIAGAIVTQLYSGIYLVFQRENRLRICSQVRPSLGHNRLVRIGRRNT